MADWLTRSPAEDILYDVDVLFGAWPSHPTDSDLATIKSHLTRHHIQNALIISTRGALFSDQDGNTETLAAAPGSLPSATSRSDRGVPASDEGELRSGSSPAATSQVGQVRGAVDAGNQRTGVPGSSASPTSPTDGAGQDSPPPGDGSSPTATSPPDQAKRSPASDGAESRAGSSPAATSRSDQVRGAVEAGEWRGVDSAGDGSSASPTSHADQERSAPAVPGGGEQGGAATAADGGGSRAGSSPAATSPTDGDDQGPPRGDGSSPSATSQSGQVRGAVDAGEWRGGASAGDGSSASPTSHADQERSAPAVPGRGEQSGAATAADSGGSRAGSSPTGGDDQGPPRGDGSSPSATSQSGQVRGAVDAGEWRGGASAGDGSSPSATSHPDHGRGEWAAPDGVRGLAGVQGSVTSPTSHSDQERSAPAVPGRGEQGEAATAADSGGSRAGSSPAATSPLEEGRGGGLAADESEPRDGSREVQLIPVGTVDLRDPVAAAGQLDGLVGRGVRFLRLFTVQQGVLGDTPGYRHVVGEAIERGLVVMQDGDPRRFAEVLGGRGAEVIFLDLHVYLLGDFLVMAQREAGFKATTRMLSSPDGIERVVDTVGARHLVFGSRTPFMDVSPQTLRLRYARISAEDRALIAGGNIQELLGKVR